jgi:hypothetical protein
MRPTLAALLAFITMAVTALPALAQSDEEVRQKAEELARARADMAAGRDSLAAADAVLFGAIDAYEATAAELRAAASSLADAEEAVRRNETAAFAARDDRNALAVTGYIDAVAGVPGTSPAIESINDILIAALLMERITAARAGETEDYESLHARLAESRAALEADRDRLVTLRLTADAQVETLVALANQAVGTLNDAVIDEADAVVAHQDAVDRLEAARRGITPGALQWEDLIERHFPDELKWEALQVLDCESRGDPFARNALSGSEGLFQFLTGTWAYSSIGAGYGGALRTDPEASVAAAAWLVRRSELFNGPHGRWAHWSCQPFLVTGSG